MYRRLKALLLILLVASLALACSKEEVQEPEAVEDKLLELDEVEKLIRDMSLEEKIGQLMILGFEGQELDDDLETRLRELQPGGLIFFKRNIGRSRQLIDLINNIKAYNESYNLPLFLAVDEEGGDVSRMPEDLAGTPSARELGEISDLDLVRDLASYSARTLGELGFNLNNGPVLDIRYNPNSEITRTRSFGSRPEDVIRLSSQYIEAYRQENILAVVKHFPGHGSTNQDSHYNLPIVNKSLEELEGEDILPFKNAIEMGVDGIMVGHILYRDLDNKYPASMSRPIIDQYLRGELGYGGLVFSDDMMMGAITNSHEPENAAFHFIRAGGDIALLCHGESIGYEFVDRVKQGLKNGEIDMESIDRKLYRILKTKEKYGIDHGRLDYIDPASKRGELEGLLERRKDSLKLYQEIESVGD